MRRRSQPRSTEATHVLATISVKVSQFMPVRLAVQEGPHEEREFEFEEHDTFVVGRSARAQFRLPIKDTSLSRVLALAAVIDRSLARAPEERFADAKDMTRALLPFR